jgi:short-subunit dehydrogenase
MEWKGKVVFITGASSGIGEALAVAMASRGAKIGLFARREAELIRIADECRKAGGEAVSLPGDVADPKAVVSAAEKLREAFGEVDMLVANAGIGGTDDATRTLTPAAVKKVIDVNLIGAVNAVHAVLPSMLVRGTGHLVAISSLAGFRGLPRSAAYCASKAGMTAYFESIRLDVQQRGVDVTIIQPGFIKTPLTSGREAQMPYIMELEDSVPYFLNAIEKRKKFAAFPWQLATLVRSARIFPAWLYDRIASRARYRE